VGRCIREPLHLSAEPELVQLTVVLPGVTLWLVLLRQLKTFEGGVRLGYEDVPYLVVQGEAAREFSVHRRLFASHNDIRTSPYVRDADFHRAIRR
jgi:hypothetical protein